MLRWKAVTPVEPLHDPCILALLITVAQGQQIVVTQEQGQPDRPSYPVSFVVRQLAFMNA
jgi:hypothetical protein